ncbi:MAG TPA: DUF1697 domain-containing protein [Gaiellales bacterium]|jgi:uncharacterized protein (DUF1697 family)
MRQIVLLRGINIGPNNRIPMPALRELLTGAGLADVRTYVQSGNVVLTSDAKPDRLCEQCEGLIAAAFGLTIPVVTRTRDELAAIVRRDPLGSVAESPKRYQVSFLSARPDPAVVRTLESLATGDERFTAVGREFYTWHAAGVARSKLWAALAGKRLGVTATARNWTTVTTLLQMADE